MRRMYSKNQLAQEVQNVVSSGELENVKVFENIVDKDGHKRFIEGNIDTKTISGVSYTYSKWSLSGSHLIIVLGFSIASGTTLNSVLLGDFTLPEWIFNKIVGLWATNNIALNNTIVYNDDWTNQTLAVLLMKSTNNKLDIRVPASSFTASKDRNARVSFDLLIGNE